MVANGPGLGKQKPKITPEYTPAVDTVQFATLTATGCQIEFITISDLFGWSASSEQDPAPMTTLAGNAGYDQYRFPADGGSVYCLADTPDRPYLLGWEPDGGDISWIATQNDLLAIQLLSQLMPPGLVFDAMRKQEAKQQ